MHLVLLFEGEWLGGGELTQLGVCHPFVVSLARPYILIKSRRSDWPGHQLERALSWKRFSTGNRKSTTDASPVRHENEPFSDYG